MAAERIGVECKKLNLARDFRLMRQKLELVQLNNAGELNDDFLGVLAKLLRLPSFGVHTGLKQLSDGVVRVFATAVDDLVVELDLAVRGLR